MPKQIFLGLIVASVLSMADVRATIACNVTTLPVELQQRVKAEFPSWKIQDSGNLTENAKARWRAEKPLACPGIAVGYFESPTHLSYAVLLVPLRNPDSAYRFLVFTPKNEEQGNLIVVESSDAPGAANGFVRKVPITKVFNAEWRRKLNVGGPEGILFVDAGLDEYEADVYFWSEGKYHHEPIDD